MASLPVGGWCVNAQRRQTVSLEVGPDTFCSPAVRACLRISQTHSRHLKVSSQITSFTHSPLNTAGYLLRPFRLNGVLTGGTAVPHLRIESSSQTPHPSRCRPVLWALRGLLLGGKPELQRVLQQRRLEQDVPPPSDLEQELRKRKQRLQEYEQEELKRKEGQENIPEFVRVKENLRRVRVAEQ